MAVGYLAGASPCPARWLCTQGVCHNSIGGHILKEDPRAAAESIIVALSGADHDVGRCAGISVADGSYSSAPVPKPWIIDASMAGPGHVDCGGRLNTTHLLREDIA